jgi:nitroreductase
VTNAVFEAVRNVLAVREYEDRPIPDEVRVGLPDGYDVLAVVPFGYPKRKLGLGKKKRKPLADVFSAETFGRPLD